LKDKNMPNIPFRKGFVPREKKSIGNGLTSEERHGRKKSHKTGYAIAPRYSDAKRLGGCWAMTVGLPPEKNAGLKRKKPKPKCMSTTPWKKGEQNGDTANDSKEGGKSGGKKRGQCVPK